mmetsp:Transcript_72017/g.120770  ORF Transcript_72017/g.120770 Transcript_72017/m.120770 type:complete len:220 (+) Transcript_72017:3477-4136(+)
MNLWADQRASDGTRLLICGQHHALGTPPGGHFRGCSGEGKQGPRLCWRAVSTDSLGFLEFLGLAGHFLLPVLSSQSGFGVLGLQHNVRTRRFAGGHCRLLALHNGPLVHRFAILTSAGSQFLVEQPDPFLHISPSLLLPLRGTRGHGEGIGLQRPRILCSAGRVPSLNQCAKMVSVRIRQMHFSVIPCCQHYMQLRQQLYAFALVRMDKPKVVLVHKVR